MQILISVYLAFFASNATDIPYHTVKLIKSLPKSYTFDTSWSESCKGNNLTLEYDIDQDGVGDSLFIRSIPSKKGKIKSWRNLDWIQPAIKMSKTSKYAVLPFMIDDEHSAWVRIGCAEDFRLNLTVDSCIKNGRYRIAHGVPTGYDERISAPLWDDLKYYYPDLPWMKNASRMSKIKASCMDAFKSTECTKEKILETFRWHRGYHFEIDSDTLKIYSADQHFEACNDTLSEKR